MVNRLAIRRLEFFGPPGAGKTTIASALLRANASSGASLPLIDGLNAWKSAAFNRELSRSRGATFKRLALKAPRRLQKIFFPSDLLSKVYDSPPQHNDLAQQVLASYLGPPERPDLGFRRLSYFHRNLAMLAAEKDLCESRIPVYDELLLHRLFSFAFHIPAASDFLSETLPLLPQDTAYVLVTAPKVDVFSRVLERDRGRRSTTEIDRYYELIDEAISYLDPDAILVEIDGGEPVAKNVSLILNNLKRQV